MDISNKIDAYIGIVFSTVFPVLLSPTFFSCVVRNPHGTKLILILSFIIVFWVLARFAIKTLGVLLQTFIVPGTSVSFLDIISARTECDDVQLKKFGAGKGVWAGTFVSCRFHLHAQNVLAQWKQLETVVTGASDGIGAEFAVQLSKAGFSVMLVGRNLSKLTVIQDTIQSVSSPYSFFLCCTN
jgi:17beta-estradiol 17-dehydrogenase / very-long-chain 3-oxoacyl-CoA reductase